MIWKLLGSLILLGALVGGGLLIFDYMGWDQGERISSGQVVQPIPTTTIAPVPWVLETYVTNLEVPWSMVFTTSDRMLVSQRPGQIVEIVNGSVSRQPLISFSDVVSDEEDGLMGLALDPEYTTNRYLYTCYTTTSSEGETIDRIVRMIDKGSQITVDSTIVDNIPAARYHAGCRLGIGPDQKLYATTGDATKKQLAQDKQSLAGKILRMNLDGSVPNDNPFANLVWTYGHRNSQGIAWSPASGKLYATEHGPSVIDGPAGGDEINLIEPGNNYGWPLVSHQETLAGTQSPLIVFTPAEAPAGAMFYSGKVFPQYTNDFFFATLKGEGVMRMEFDSNDPTKVLGYEKLPIQVGRVRDVVESPDGFIYLSTSNRDGRGKPTDKDDVIYRLVPEH